MRFTKLNSGAGDQMKTSENLTRRLRDQRRLLQRRNRRDAGYTLMELLVVMGILAVLTAVATPQLMGYFGKAKTQTVQLQIENIGTALELYYMENGSYRSASAGLKYRLQFKSNLTDAAWQTLGADTVATNTTAFKSDSGLAGAPQRFYRVLLVN